MMIKHTQHGLVNTTSLGTNLIIQHVTRLYVKMAHDEKVSLALHCQFLYLTNTYGMSN